MIDSDDLYGPMEVGDVLSTALGTETVADRDMVPPSFDCTPGSSGRYPTYRDLRAPEVSERRAQYKEADHTGEDTLADDTIKACGCLKVW
jgi:hypothetical protein